MPLQIRTGRADRERVYIVSKPTTTDFISLASESGAFTDTINAPP
jgi:hypothetical protein